MTGSIDKVKQAFEAAEDVSPEKGLEAASKRRNGPSKRENHAPEGSALIEGRGATSVLPRDFPIQPLGQVSARFYFLTARGEMAELNAGAMTNRANLVALACGAVDSLDCLAELAPPRNNKDNVFNTAHAADRLMEACSVLPLFDTAMPIRHCGTWRGPNASLVVHAGEDVLYAGTHAKIGQRIGRALYPSIT